ncbi:MAG: glycoside hydrolase family 25 [Clostridia bacterium]|nr:glycoside hydrolase family 25 [Clostridia bacterium]
MKTNKKVIIALIALVAISVIVIISLFWFGILHFNNPPSDSVIGIDVSSYQGDIDWTTLSSQNISFAFIKATEGSSFVDPCFTSNWTNAADTDLRIGAYHFFSFESSGEKQAKFFCSTVTPVDNMLPPVIDVEFYGKFKSVKDIDADAVKHELRVFVDLISAEYGMKPIIYVTNKSFEAIVKNDFSDCDLWFRSVYSSIPNEIKCSFWQFSNRHRLDGYNGKEPYIDMNVFCGSSEEFANYPN